MTDPNKPLTIQLHPNELDYIGKCLHRQPYGDVAPLLAKIQVQVIEQQRAEAEALAQAQQQTSADPNVTRPTLRAVLAEAAEAATPDPDPAAA